MVMVRGGDHLMTIGTVPLTESSGPNREIGKQLAGIVIHDSVKLLPGPAPFRALLKGAAYPIMSRVWHLGIARTTNS